MFAFSERDLRGLFPLFDLAVVTQMQTQPQITVFFLFFFIVSKLTGTRAARDHLFHWPPDGLRWGSVVVVVVEDDDDVAGKPPDIR